MYIYIYIYIYVYVDSDSLETMRCLKPKCIFFVFFLFIGCESQNLFKQHQQQAYNIQYIPQNSQSIRGRLP